MKLQLETVFGLENAQMRDCVPDRSGGCGGTGDVAAVWWGMPYRSALAAAACLVLAACQGAGSSEPGTGPTQAFDAIAPGETVRFTGTEPFWGGEVAGDRLRYSTPENIDGEVLQVARFAGNNGLGYSGRLDGKPFDMTVTPGTCSDGMSDRRYPFTVTLRIGEERREGCAWTEAKPYRGGEAG